MFKKNKNLSEVNYLELTPVRNYNHIVEDINKVSVLIPRFTNKILVKYLVPRLKSPDIKVKLDKFGSAAWLKADGNNNVQTICDELLSEFGDEINPVVERVTKFYSQLYQYQFISFKELKERK
ncbi:MAG: PqqD family protein [Ignavibacterium album]|uniref:PqqD family protein n=1 Tax=Ignavibacterium album TaxID=591197 RepID=UPI0026E9D4CE|nr:PqqD family protein [Ignavibacterium album]MCX8107044.1 PqqD family protein [Ignavibacterium album]